MKIISYLRVSTARQRQNGPSLKPQRNAVQEYAINNDAHLIKEFVEVESGVIKTRPKLSQAVRLASQTDSTLVIAKLDRLSQNAAFLLFLKNAGIRFIAADLPNANERTVGAMALIAQQEYEALFNRAKEGLDAAKRRVVWAKTNETATPRKTHKGNVAAVRAVKLQADAHAEALRPILRELTNEGLTSPGEIAKAFSERGILTARGGAWHDSTVLNLLARLNSSEGT